MFAWVSPMFRILDLQDLKQLLLRLSEVIQSKTFFIGHYPFSLSVHCQKSWTFHARDQLSAESRF